MKRTFAGAALSLDLLAGTQDTMYGVDLSSPVSAEMTRAQIEIVLARATAAMPADSTGKRLSNLDLSRLDLSGAILRGPDEACRREIRWSPTK